MSKEKVDKEKVVGYLKSAKDHLEHHTDGVLRLYKSHVQYAYEDIEKALEELHAE